MIRRPPRSTHCISSAASDVYKRQVYHLRCLDRKTKPSRGWRCAFCDVTQLRTWVTNRRAISQLPLVALLQNAKHQRDQLRFVPLNFVRLQAAVRATVEFGVAVAMQFQAGRLPSILIDAPAKTGQAIDLPPPSPQLRHIARRALACPIDVLLPVSYTHLTLPTICSV